MALTVAQAFGEFAAKIKPTAVQEQTIADRRSNVEGFLLAKYPSGSTMPLTHVRTIGSAGRKTLIRPVDDVDVFAVFDDNQVWTAYQYDSKQLLYRVREALAGYSVKTVGSRGQAVRLFYSDGTNVDITPAFPVTGYFGGTDGYVIPKGDGGWQPTNPYKHHDFMAERNQALGGYLKPLVRMLKRWNSSHSSRIKGFHLEVITQASFTALGSSMRENVYAFFQYAGGHIHVQDPAGYSGGLASGWSWQKQQDVSQSFLTALSQVQRARSAEAAGDPGEAMRQWRTVFGNEFPSCG
jgi:hypothetical protein